MSDTTVSPSWFKPITCHPAYQRIDARRTGNRFFDPFVALGVSGRELSYSAALYWLLATDAFASFRDAFIHKLLYPDIGAGPEPDLFRIPLPGPHNWESLSVSSVVTEKSLPRAGQIDLLATLSRGACNEPIILGIENKISAAEGEEQLSRYADGLRAAFPCKESPILLVFLTPHGRLPTSFGETEQPRVYPRALCWSSVAEELEANQPSDTEHAAFATSFARHIREKVMGNTPDRADTRELFDHPDRAETLLRIIKNQPRLHDMRGIWLSTVQNWLGSKDPTWTDIDIREGANELILKVRAWEQAGLPICFMVTKETPDGTLSVRVLVHKNDYAANESSFIRLASLSDGSINTQFQPIWGPAMPWLSLLPGDQVDTYPEWARVRHYAYNDRTADLCINVLSSQFDRIETSIRSFLSGA